jgi:hypothetical protein
LSRRLNIAISRRNRGFESPWGRQTSINPEVKKRAEGNLTFQDLRREAAIRLHEAGHSVEQIAKVTGRIDLNALLRDIGAGASSSAAAETYEEVL